MFKPVQIQEELSKERIKIRNLEETLLFEANKLLLEEQFDEKNILSNLRSYNRSFTFLNEEGLDPNLIFTLREIKNICVRYRLRFVDSQLYTGEFPYESLLKIKDLNALQRKDLLHFKILTTKEKIRDPEKNEDALLFCQTIYGNYFLIHRWGDSLPAKRKWISFPLRNFESLFLCVILFTAAVTFILPNKYLTTDLRAGYFSLYRIACFFHVLILATGFTIFYVFGRSKTFSSTDWDNPKV
ncbi:MAG: hypothetical protein Q8M29_06910 [Bacteroidota bacterium]|nr:hypothetical protein [Bacteroidota bacterium]